MAAEEQAQGQGSPEERYQELMSYAEQVRSELNSVEEQRQMMQDVLQDYTRGREALTSLRDEGEAEVLVPLGGGNYAPATLQDTTKVLMSLGSRLHAEGDVDAALKRLDSREEQAKQATEQLKEQSQKLVGEMTRLNQEMQQLQAMAAGGGQGGQGGGGHEGHEHHEHGHQQE